MFTTSERRQTQSLLGPAEALLIYVTDTEESVLWAVRSDRRAMYRLPVGRGTVVDRVGALRQSLGGVERLADIKPFPLDAAHELYRSLVEPAAGLIGDADRLIVVADGPLTSLPFALLAIDAYPTPPPGDFARYRKVRWLAQRWAVTVLPGPSALRALRRHAHGSSAAEPFIGFGDPILAEPREQAAGAQAGERPAPVRPIADPAEIRARVSRLRQTAGELSRVAEALGAGTDAVRLGSAATEAAVKRMDLSPYRVVAFATHGLLAGDLPGLAEPALVLTPPEVGGTLDDGLLTASEVARLKLNADWVVLSACNTAGADGAPGAEGLWGLARAFFYAGTRALLVSHWEVESTAAARLTTETFRALERNPGIGRSEALRRSMMTLMGDPKDSYYAHPFFWAPFVVVGEGGTGAR